MDVHSPKQRSFNMSRIKGRDTRPEMLIRKWLWASGYRYRLHKKDLPGKPDIVFPGRKKLIFIHGCFWHRHECNYFQWPETNRDFWKQKIGETVKRDQRNYEKLTSSGWDCMTIWECEITGNENNKLREKVKKFLIGEYIK